MIHTGLMRLLLVRLSLCLSVCLLLIFNLVGPAQADNTGVGQKFDNTGFPYQAEQDIRFQAASPFMVIVLDPAIYATMDPSLKDMRVFAGEYELGYALLPAEKGSTTILPEEKLAVINQGPLEKGEYSFVVVTKEVGENQGLKVILQPAPYLVKGNLFGSNDNRSWQELRAVTLFGIENKYNEISLAGIDYDYVKIIFTQPPGEVLTVKEITTAALGMMEQDFSPLEEMPFTARVDEKSKESMILIDLEHKNRLSSEWHIATNDKGFYRRVIAEGSNDKDRWELLGATYIYRGVDAGDEKLSFSYSPAGYRYLRLRILNEDNLPVEIQSVKVKVHPVKLIAKIPSSLQGSSFKMTAYWGNVRLQAPSYDVAALVNEKEIDHYPVVKIAAKEENPNYKPLNTVPFSERYPFLLPLGLAVTVLAVAYILISNMRKTG